MRSNLNFANIYLQYYKIENTYHASHCVDRHRFHCIYDVHDDHETIHRCHSMIKQKQKKMKKLIRCKQTLIERN